MLRRGRGAVMKMRFMIKAVQKAGHAAAAVEKLHNRGHCTVLKVKCNGCEQWVEPDAWNPDSAVCDGCTSYLVSLGVAVRKPVRWIPMGNGRPRKQTGVK